jgi:hypothetical protein
MIKMSEPRLRIGDVILYNSNNWFEGKIQKLLELQDYIDGGKANHAAIYAGDGDVMESNWKGVEFNKLNPVNNGMFAILRPIRQFDEEEMQQAIMKYFLEHDGQGYSYKGLLSAAVSALVGFVSSVITLGKIRLKPVLFKEEKAPFCSEAVAEIHEYYPGIRFTISNDVISPNDLYRSRAYKIIQDFED